MVSFSKSNWSKSLESLTLSFTSISGKIPDSIGEFKNLKTLYLSNCTLTGSIASSLVNLTKLTNLDLSHDELTGHIPSFVVKLEQLMDIPIWFWDVGKGTLQSLDISNNLIEGSIQQFPWKELIDVDLSHNLFQGPLSIPPLHIVYFLAIDNGFNGEIPPSICKLRSLKPLDLACKNLSGSIPQCLGNLTNLLYLDLSANKFEGKLPRSLDNCASLFFLNISYNKINDIFSKFEGPLPTPPPATQFYFVANNKIGGKLPKDIGNLKSLKGLNFSHNNLTGYIPSSTGNLTELEWLDLSSNKFTGRIP
ncbi:hypothetical protein EUGRSUZ_K01593 [Eucalyptus grandis]|uniref:Uncharacterized protein n=2 Tax=Eucalyptus grandis TaxID=71139 RepID=A0ACC3IU34_EUCGR|nr:hypothetical protein EUGRSUZ_K01593 [Eucalyptus grandis]